MQDQQHPGILKKMPSVEQKEQNKHIQWDQQSLRIDALQRGKCQKIDQPKTPYHQHRTQVEQGQGSLQDKTVKQYLDEANHNAQMNKGGPKLDINQLNVQLQSQMEKAGFSLGASEPPEDPEQIKKKEQFEEKRRAHYNEFSKIKNMQEKEESSGSQAEG